MRSGRSIDREILRLAVPALGALIAEPLYLLADTAVIARLGTTALAGFGIASSILLTVTAPLLFLAYVTTSVVARRVGAGDHRGAADHAVQALWLAFSLGIALIFGGFLAAPSIVDLFHPEAAVAADAVVYLRVSLFGVPALLLGFAGTGYLRGFQDARTPLIVAAGAAAGNLAIELVLIYGFGLGIAASAAGTVLAQWAAATAYVRMVAKAARPAGVSFRPDPVGLRAVIRVSLDLFVRTLALRAAFLSTTIVAARFGTVPLAASEVALTIFLFFAFCLDALAIAAQSMVGLRVGAGNLGALRPVVNRLVGWGLVLGAAAGLLLLIGHEVLATLITPDPGVAATLSSILVVVAAMQPVAGVVFVLDGVLIGAGAMRGLAIAMLISLAVYLPLAAAVVRLELGIVWLWGAVGAFLLARLFTLVRLAVVSLPAVRRGPSSPTRNTFRS